MSVRELVFVYVCAYIWSVWMCVCMCTWVWVHVCECTCKCVWVYTCMLLILLWEGREAYGCFEELNFSRPFCTRVHLPYLSGSFQYTGYKRNYWLIFRVLLGLVRKLGSPISNPLQHEFFIQVKELVHDLPHLHQQVNCSQDRCSTENPSIWSHKGEPNSSSSSKSQICQGATSSQVSPGAYLNWLIFLQGKVASGAEEMAQSLRAPKAHNCLELQAWRSDTLCWPLWAAGTYQHARDTQIYMQEDTHKFKKSKYKNFKMKSLK